jgi:hypothetical protein
MQITAKLKIQCNSSMNAAKHMKICAAATMYKINMVPVVSVRELDLKYVSDCFVAEDIILNISDTKAGAMCQKSLALSDGEILIYL